MPNPARNIGAAPPDTLADARVQLHFAVEWVARIGRFLVVPRPDYSHISLGWDREIEALATYPLPPEAGGVRFALSIAQFKIIMYRDGAPEWELPLNGITHRALGARLQQQLNDLGLEGSAIHGDIPYKLQHPRLSAGQPYGGADLAKPLLALEAWFAGSAKLLEEERGGWSHISPGPSPVRCWPHHFDLATLVQLDAGDPKEARSIGFGMSPGDETYSRPYLYINPWPRPEDTAALPSAPPGAQWHTEGFFSLVLLAEAVLGAPDPLARMRAHIIEGGKAAAALLNYVR